jgi:hypothetical protein
MEKPSRPEISSAVALSEMPETPGLNLAREKISTATRKKLVPFTTAERTALTKAEP